MIIAKYVLNFWNMANGIIIAGNLSWGGNQTWDLSKNLRDLIFGPKILHTKSAEMATIFTKKETALTTVILVAFC